MAGKTLTAGGTLLLVLLAQSGVLAQWLPFAGSDEPVWTDRPVRIDRSTQHFERIAGPLDAYATRIRITPQVQVSDGASFADRNRIYILSDIVGPAPQRLCRTDDGIRFACGAQARAFLKQAILGRILECSVRPLAGTARLVDCRVGSDSLAGMIVSAGFSRAVAGGSLSARQADAIAGRAGLWADPSCRQSMRC